MICQCFATSYLPLPSASANNWRLATNQSWYFALTHPIIDNYLINRFSKNVQVFPKSNRWSTGSLWLSASLSAWTRRSVSARRGSSGILFQIAEIFKWLAKCFHGYALDTTYFEMFEILLVKIEYYWSSSIYYSKTACILIFRT